SFFDLGGDSLLGTQVITRVRDAWGIDLPLPALFELPTPAALAARIESLRPEGETEGEKIARMLARLESLSPEEVERMLAERGAVPDP
ncbi:MAG TPA: phosphopantetheine-binding protein, partial [Thermoanaerobaculia bacterium]|nr:phosphopantetheine-binding protein [Thermoanaerobaculia bacterium]